MSSESDVFTCEKILKKRIHKGVPLYLIKWEGYPLKASTWEPAEHFMDPTLLSAFEEELNRKKVNKKRPKRTSQASISTPEPETSLQENGNQSPHDQTLSPSPSTQATKTPTPTPASEPSKSPELTIDQSFISNGSSPSPGPTPNKQFKKARTPTPKPESKPEPRPENGTPVLAQKQLSTAVKKSSPVTRTSEVQTSPRPQLSNANILHARPFTVITDVTVNSRTITISESLCNGL